MWQVEQRWKHIAGQGEASRNNVINHQWAPRPRWLQSELRTVHLNNHVTPTLSRFYGYTSYMTDASFTFVPKKYEQAFFYLYRRGFSRRILIQQEFFNTDSHWSVAAPRLYFAENFDNNQTTEHKRNAKFPCVNDVRVEWAFLFGTHKTR